MADPTPLAGGLIAPPEGPAGQRETHLLNIIDALRAYTQHEPMCKAALYPGLGKCACGLRDVLDRARQAAPSPLVPPSAQEPS